MLLAAYLRCRTMRASVRRVSAGRDCTKMFAMLLAGVACVNIGCTRCVKPEQAGRVPWQTNVRSGSWEQRSAALQALDPEATARAMFDRNRVAFAGIDGFVGNMRVGVTLTEREACRYPTARVEGTSDSPSVGAEEEFQTIAVQFAERFNREMLRLLRSR